MNTETTSVSEAQRIQRLQEIGILDTPESRLFRSLAEQAMALLPGTSMAGVTLVDTDRQWYKTIVGANLKETSRSVSFCSHTIGTSGVMIVEDATQDSRFVGSPLVTTYPGIRFYAGVKLMNSVGALCVMDQQPRRASENEIGKLARLAQCVDIQLLAHGALFALQSVSRAGEPLRR